MKGADGRISLTRGQIQAAIARCAEPIQQYEWLQQRFAQPNVDVRLDKPFQGKFGVLYKLRGRNNEWRKIFFSLLEQQRHAKAEFKHVLEELYRLTKQIEASFSSKLVATVDPNQPVIDSVVLDNVGLKLPRYGHRDRLSGAVEVHAKLGALYRRFLRSADGAYLVQQFQASHPEARLTPVKMVDFVLWQTRTRKRAAKAA